jgi:hypothetical protein
MSGTTRNPHPSGRGGSQWKPGKDRLVAVGAVAICGACLDLCDELLAEEQAG